MALTLARCCSILDKLLISYDDEAVLKGLAPAEKAALLSKLAIIAGISFDKWRLASGKSTSNNSHHVQVNQIHQSLDFSAPSSASVSDEGPHQSPTR